MEKASKFLGINKSNLPIIVLQLTLLAVIIIMFSMQNAAINRLCDEITEMRSEMREDIREIIDDMDTLDDDADAKPPHSRKGGNPEERPLIPHSYLISLPQLISHPPQCATFLCVG